GGDGQLMPLRAPPPLAFALSLPGAAPGAAAGCWACARRVMSAAKAATNTGAVRSFMTDDCTRNGGRLHRTWANHSLAAASWDRGLLRRSTTETRRLQPGWLVM